MGKSRSVCAPRHRRAVAARGPLLGCDRRYLYENVTRQASHLHGCASRRLVLEICCIQRVHPGEVIQVFQKHGSGYDIVHRHAIRSQSLPATRAKSPAPAPRSEAFRALFLRLRSARAPNSLAQFNEGAGFLGCLGFFCSLRGRSRLPIANSSKLELLPAFTRRLPAISRGRYVIAAARSASAETAAPCSASPTTRTDPDHLCRRPSCWLAPCLFRSTPPRRARVLRHG